MSQTMKACVLWVLCLSVVGLGGCANTTTRRADGLSATSQLGANKRILLMPFDIELSELMATGLTEPKAEWSEAAKAHVEAAFREELGARGANWVAYDPEKMGADQARARQLELLYEAVGGAILYIDVLRVDLPSKPNFDWTLGPGVQVLGQRYEADYAVFTFVRDSYSTAGRKAFMALGAVFGVSVSLGQQLGFTSLVDLRTGQVIWINFLASGSGDLRDAQSAKQAVGGLLKGLPL